MGEPRRGPALQKRHRRNEPAVAHEFEPPQLVDHEQTALRTDGNGALSVGFVRLNDDARTSRTWIGRGLARLRSRCFT